MSMTQFMELVRNHRSNPSLCVKNAGSGESWKEYRETPQCIMLGELELYVDNQSIGYSDLRRHFESYVGRIVVSRLFREQIMSPDDCNQIQYTRSVANKMNRFSMSGACGDGVDVQCCQEARRVMRSWWMDFVWSEEQHRMGTDFAIENCKNDPTFVKSGLESQSCAVLELQRKSEPASGSETRVEN